MANTTNFGWETPDDTDLVKDGAAAMRTLGNAIDTSLVDLKGGTSGQILAKNSNTDMDFVWITNDVGDITEVVASSPLTGGGSSGSVTIAIQDATTAQKGAVQLTNSTSSTSTTTAATPSSVKSAYDLADAAIAKSIVNAKGDLVSASANDTPAILTAGNNGENLVADSGATTGLRWNPSPTLCNPIINGAYDIAQRGTSFTTAGAVAYTLDRWQSRTAAAGGSVVTTQELTSDTTNLPFIQYCARLRRSTSNSDTNNLEFYTALENSNSTPYIGQTVTISFYARKSANFTGTFNALLISGTGTNQALVPGFTGAATVANNAASLTTTWTRYTATGTVGTSATQLGFLFRHSPSGTAGADDYYEVTGVQIDLGSVALPFRRSGGTLAGELAACQRYYQKSFAQATAPGNNISGVGAVTAFNAPRSGSYEPQVYVMLPVSMRIAPTVTLYNPGSGTTGQWWDGVSASSANARAFNATESTFIVDNTDVTLAWTRDASIQYQAVSEL